MKKPTRRLSTDGLTEVITLVFARQLYFDGCIMFTFVCVTVLSKVLSNTN